MDNFSLCIQVQLLVVIFQLLEMYQSPLGSVFWPKINSMMKADVTCHLPQGFWWNIENDLSLFIYFSIGDFTRDLLCILFLKLCIHGISQIWII